MRAGAVVRVVGRRDTKDARCPPCTGSGTSILTGENCCLIADGALRSIKYQRTGDNDFLILRVVSWLRRIGCGTLTIAVQHQHFRSWGSNGRWADGVGCAGSEPSCSPLRQSKRTAQVGTSDSAADGSASNGSAKGADRISEGKAIATEDTAVEPTTNNAIGRRTNTALVYLSPTSGNGPCHIPSLSKVDYKDIISGVSRERDCEG